MKTRIVLALSAFLFFVGSHIGADLTFDQIASVPMSVWFGGLAEASMGFLSPSLVGKGIDKSKSFIKGG